MVHRGRDQLGNAGNKNREGINGQGRTELRDVRGCKAKRSHSWFQLSWWLHTALNEVCGCVACWWQERCAGSGGKERGAPHAVPAVQKWAESPNPPSRCWGSQG